MKRDSLTIQAKLTAVALLLTIAACGGEPPSRKALVRDPVTAEVALAAVEPTPIVLEVTGTVTAWARVSPGTKILGRIAALPVREGDRVERGALLARLEQADLEASVAQARAALAMAEATATNAQTQQRRIETLHARGSVTDKAREDALAGAAVAAAAVAQARAHLEAAEVMLGYAEIRSPLGGVVTRKWVEAGDMATPGALIVTIEDLSRAKIVLTISESDVVGLAEGTPVRVGVDVLGREWEATIDRVIPAGDPTTRTFDVEIVLPNPDGALKSGMFARARFERAGRDALFVPRSAIVERGQLAGLFVLDGEGVARLRWVRLGREVDARFEVLSGLVAGESYLPQPPDGIVDGTPVREG